MARVHHHDPLIAVLTLGRRQRHAMSIGVAVALLVHGAAAGHGMSRLLELHRFASEIRAAVISTLPAELDVEVVEPEPPPPPEPEPEPEPEEEPEPPPPTPEPPPEKVDAPPPAAAEAGKILTAEPDPNEPIDLTGEGFVTGEGDRFAGGVTASDGTSKTAVRDLRAVGGVPDVKTAAVRGPTGPDRSRPAAPLSTNWDDCGFPAEADMEGINQARVPVAVTVRADGTVQNVTVLKDPGYGFGGLARQCAKRKRFTPALNREGRPFTTTLPPITIRFTR